MLFLNTALQAARADTHLPVWAALASKGGVWRQGVADQCLSALAAPGMTWVL